MTGAKVVAVVVGAAVVVVVDELVVVAAAGVEVVAVADGASVVVVTVIGGDSEGAAVASAPSLEQPATASKAAVTTAAQRISESPSTSASSHCRARRRIRLDAGMLLPSGRCHVGAASASRTPDWIPALGSTHLGFDMALQPGQQRSHALLVGSAHIEPIHEAPNRPEFDLVLR